MTANFQNTGVRLLLLWFSLLILTSCKKDPEPADPQIVFESPYQNEIFNVFDTLHVKAVITSEEKLTGLSVTLVDESLNPVLATYPVAPGTGQEYSCTLNLYIPIDAIQLESGKYFVWIQAATSVSTKNKYLAVKIIELKKELKKILLLIRTNAEITSLFSLDADLHLQHQFDFSQDFLSAAIDPLHSVLYVAGRNTGKLTAFHLDSNRILWQKSGAGTPQLPYYRDIRQQGNMLLVSTSDGSLTAYDHQGEIQFFKDFGMIQYPVANYISGNILISGVEQKNGNLRYLNNYFYPSGAYQSGVQIPFHVVSILPSSSEMVLIAGNQDGSGLITYYYYKEPGLWTPFPFPAGIIKKVVPGITGNYFALTSASVQWIQTSTNTLSTFSTSQEEMQDITYDITTDHLMTVIHNTLKVYHFPQPSLISTIPLPDSVKACVLWYNK